jgi:hypothetical protein
MWDSSKHAICLELLQSQNRTYNEVIRRSNINKKLNKNISTKLQHIHANYHVCVLGSVYMLMIAEANDLYTTTMNNNF